MNLDIKRLNQYLYEIKENTDDLEDIPEEFDIPFLVFQTQLLSIN
ncbi:MAG: hypothetical protein QMD43_00700 [Thermodesulfovibrio sp.]|nr:MULTISPECIES: hypothetical protein [unclassified Thermodesulfovibrio]MDI1472829.1 hypothetical protein [Thermodesulfovibrio sp. 1176]MDI6713529.1 hypothetical protein [Thermodesulfovibrio sp.]ODA44010.1 hypothetical protein THER_1289 [Thermodesulfovibrio sp. N1]